MPLSRILLPALLAALCGLSVPLSPCPAEEPNEDHAELERQVRPLLSDTCFKCHGFDASSRVTTLRLDTADGPTTDLGGYQAVVPGERDLSELWSRITSDDEFEHMPPPDSGRLLTDEQTELIGRWIDAGAPWRGHWAFLTPQRPDLPEVTRPEWCRNPIDYFVLARLTAAGLAPSPEADRATLIRRVTLDLTGLPPTPAEIDAFVADDSPDAYERLVDRLLASPRYGEFMALPWLDAARYSDTIGYQADLTRPMWPWRDRLVAALNENQPFDEFTIEQLAGDMLPNATLEQIVASGFNRNHMVNNEGGAIPEESRVEYVINRVETTGAVWLGMTVGCGRCHDHKYDPLSQREFYSLTAFFNNVDETGKVDGPVTGTAAPTIRVHSFEEERRLDSLREQIAVLQRQLARPPAGIAPRAAAWEAELDSDSTWETLAPLSFTSAGGAELTRLDDDSLLASGANPDFDRYQVTVLVEPGTLTGLRLEVLPHESLPHGGTGRYEDGSFVLNQVTLEAFPLDGSQPPRAVAFADAAADYTQGGHDPRFLIAPEINKEGWAADAYRDGMRGRRAVVLVPAEPLVIERPTWLHFTLVHDSNWKGRNIGRFRLSSTGNERPLELFSLPEDVLAALLVPADQRDEVQRTRLVEYYWSQTAEAEEIRGRLTAARSQIQEIENAAPVVMVMQERDQRRPTYVLERGQYDQHGKEVEPGVPACLPPMPENLPNNRLGLAEWLVSGQHPLTGRVTVNRYWQQFFGMGLVKTAEDFGVQGDPPSHPDLFDWLAVEFARDWDVKRMHRLIVTSATYRQSSGADAHLLEVDPDNRLLSRGPRHRLNSFAIRDQALALAGLLVEETGGPPVQPYQPAGVWSDFSLGQIRYEQQHGQNLYRRSLYTFWRRSVGPTNMFDIPNRQVCTVRQPRTNTPLHSLVLMNDVTYIEAARLFAERMMRQGGATPEERIAWAFRSATARWPNQREEEVLANTYQRTLAAYQADPQAALELLSVGEYPRDESLDPYELAACTGVANVILNLDETISKE